MDLLVDDFAEQLQQLVTQGWVITEYGRYDPTRVVGLTPTGKAFTLDADGTTITITVAGRTRTVTVAGEDAWMRGADTVAAWQQAYNLLPVSQR